MNYRLIDTDRLEHLIRLLDAHNYQHDADALLELLHGGEPSLNGLWQPIASAPKDRRILLLRPHFHGHEQPLVSCGRWDDQADHAAPRPFWSDDSLSGRGVSLEPFREHPPTHWMQIDGTAPMPALMHDIKKRLPVFGEGGRILIYTQGVDFGGEQFFDCPADALDPSCFNHPDDQPETVRAATHWMYLDTLLQHLARDA